MISKIQDYVLIPKDRLMRVIFLLFIVFTFFLFLYSFTQIDLSLTLSRSAFWIPIQDFFKGIGYFNRPLSTLLYLTIFFGLSFLYVLLLYGVHEKKITKKQVFFLVGLTTLLLVFSYNAFSYDLFNYIFDAKIITRYHDNPYFKMALDYPHDPLLSFMHWTHRTYPYGPGWLILTVPLSFLGLQYFLPTFFLFKITIAFCFMGSAYFIYKISQRLDREYALFSLVFFACNPLVLIESLVSSHNDIVMLFFALLGLWYFMEKKYKKSILSLFFSISIKFATILLLPGFILAIYLRMKKKEVSWEKIVYLLIGSMSLATIAATSRTNFQPWYLLYVLPFSALVARKYYIFIPSIIISLGALFQYVPFLFLGNWNPPVPAMLYQMLASSIIISVIIIFLFATYLNFKKSRTRQMIQ